jgi:hypothetical protein
MALQQPILDAQVRVQIERIIAEDARRHSPEEIEGLARTAAARYEHAPVQQYVLNLIYNEVKTKLIEGRK